MIRKPVVNGQFYPQNKEETEKFIKSIETNVSSQINAKGIILPHAGYIYSGRVAIETLARILPKKRLLILGPNHSGLGKNFALWAKGAWEIHSEQIKIDEKLAEFILKNGDVITEDYLAHGQEHSVEVQLPLIRHFFRQFEFVPISCRNSGIDTYEEVANQILKGIKSVDDDILFIASTDLTHYEPDQVARKKDRLAIEAIINLDEKELLRKVKNNNITMCGESAVAILILCLKKMKAKKSQVVLYQTSADASGDKEAVVGYGGIIIN